MRDYAVKNKENKLVSILHYNEENGEFHIDIPENISEEEAPFFMSLFLKKGIRHIDSDWSLRWVQSRVVPSSRQNIGQILRANGLERYGEYALLIRNHGLCCQDDCYLESM